MVQRCRHSATEENAVQKTPGQHPGHILTFAPADFPGGEIHGCCADAAHAGNHCKAPHGHGQLQQSDPRRTDAAGEIDLKRSARKPQEQIDSREHQGTVKNRMPS